MNEFILFYNGFLDRWADFFFTNSIEILFLALPAAIFSLLLRNKSPRFHYIIWTIVLLKTLLPSQLINLPVNDIYTLQLPAVITTTYAEKIEPTLNLYHNFLFLIWAAIAGLLLIKLISNTISFQKILSKKTTIDSKIIQKLQNHYDIKKRVRVYEADVNVPFTIGFLKPKIFLPLNSDMDKITFILAHEMAHIKRHDFLLILIQNMITILFFFHPVVLIASGLLNYYREIICDDMAVEAIQSSPQNYGRKILEYLEFCLKQKKYPLLANGLFFSKKIIIRRIQYLINRKETMIKKLSKIQILLITSMICLLILVVACESLTEPASDNFLAETNKDIRTLRLEKLSNNLTEVPDSTLIHVKLAELADASEITILKKSNSNQMDQEALKSVRALTRSMKDAGMSEAKVNVVFKKSTNIPNPNMKFIPYDEPPQPIGGFAGIEKNILYPKVAQDAFVDEKGDVSDTSILRGHPNTGLNEAAIAAIKKTKFKPAKQKEKNVGVWISIPIVFRLNNN
jgi:TonB family protein